MNHFIDSASIKPILSTESCLIGFQVMKLETANGGSFVVRYAFASQRGYYPDGMCFPRIPTLLISLMLLSIFPCNLLVRHQHHPAQRRSHKLGRHVLVMVSFPSLTLSRRTWVYGVPCSAIARNVEKCKRHYTVPSKQLMRTEFQRSFECLSSFTNGCCCL